MKCSKCGNDVVEGAIFCDSCGNKMESVADLVTCPNCGAMCEEESEFCGGCGAKLLKLTATVVEDVQGRICPKCKTEWAEDVLFCGECGAQTVEKNLMHSTEDVFAVEEDIPVAKQYCGGCGAELEAGAEFCGLCGFRVAHDKVDIKTDPIPTGGLKVTTTYTEPAVVDKSGSEFFRKAGNADLETNL